MTNLRTKVQTSTAKVLYFGKPIFNMAGYRIISLFQAIASLFLALSVFDYGGLIGLNSALNLILGTWWGPYTFWAYLIVLIAILQLVKAFIVRERD